MKENDFNICITIDVDFTAYEFRNELCNEFEEVFPMLWALFSDRPNWRATWFVRLDHHMKTIYGCPDYIFTKYKREISYLRELGHEIGWHPHCYSNSGNKWSQNVDTSKILKELNELIPLVKSHHLNVARMGWGFQTNEIMRHLSERGFTVDSSAIPRPRYQWEDSIKDWTSTPLYPYYPSIHDYRIPGDNHLQILEVPMSVAYIMSPDDEGEVLRCFNLSYKPEVLKVPLENWINNHNHLVTVAHPYELMTWNTKHPLYAYNINAFESNVLQIEDQVAAIGKHIKFITTSDFIRYPV